MPPPEEEAGPGDTHASETEPSAGPSADAPGTPAPAAAGPMTYAAQEALRRKLQQRFH
ncbi:hypothetical protein [Streptomyces erythrochromogenes]|uniref:hypothetical protein n=1 Tax=Streptomyces erythrochromogenes TaxID=285574 RepID=UPI0036A81E92